MPLFESPEAWAEWYAPQWPVKAALFIARHDKDGDSERPRAIALKAVLPAHGFCRICGRKLGKKLSKERGVGKTCWDKLQAAAA